MKIYLELMVDNKALTKLENVLIKGSEPELGFGSWLASQKLTKKQVENMKQKKLKEFMKWEMEQTKYKKLNKEQQLRYQEKLKKRFIGNLDPIHLRAQVLQKEFDMNYPKRLMFKGLKFNDKGKNGDEKAGDGIYTAEQKLTKEGIYQFYFTVIDSSRGKHIRRENQLQKYVNVRIRPDKIVKDILRIDTILKERRLYNVTLNLHDSYGNLPSPDALRNIKLKLEKGELIGNIKSNSDGTFTQIVSLPENIEPAKMRMIVQDQENEGKIESSIPNWKYLLFILLFIIAIIIYLRRKK